MDLAPANPDSPRRFLTELAFVLLSNTAIALFMAVAGIENLRSDFIYAQAIGTCIFLVIRSVCKLRRRNIPGLLEAGIGIPAGGSLGFVLGSWGNGFSVAEVVEIHPQALVVSAAGALLFGAIAAYYFHAHGRFVDAEAEAHNERLRRMEQEALAARAELRLLQAQIEPHFLFNTLSNAVGLIDEDPAAARALLIDLTTLLRVALARSRREETTLAEELDLLRAYLGIMARRMGERLRWRIDAEPELLGLRLPPLLIQPLVENAIRHGLEPRATGGEIEVACRRMDNGLAVVVTDNGGGLGGQGIGGNGVGLANVRARLAARYGGKGRLELAESPGGGVAATLSLPLEENPCVS